MSRRFQNNIRGPTSALTEYLKTTGITATTIARRVATQQQQQPEPGSSNDAENQDSEQNIESPGSRRRVRRRGAQGQAANGYASDELDEPESPPKKQKLSKTDKAKRKTKSKKDDDAYEDEDNYTALSKSLWTSSTPKPSVGSRETCAKCEKEFTVTKYTMASGTGPGFLCHPCAKSSGTDPFKKTAAPRKRKAPAERRNVAHFEELRIPTLVSLCVQIVSRHINDIEAFGDIGDMNMTAIAKAISKNRSLTSENAQLFYGVRNTTLTFYDATKLSPDALCTLGYLNPNLTTLRLDYCGLMSDSVLEAWGKSLPNLTSLQLLGPFLVRAPAWIDFFKAHTKLESFLITQSPRFDLECMNTLVECCSPTLRKLGLREVGKMSDDFLQAMKSLEGLTYLDISEPAVSCSDEAVIELLSVVGPTLTELNLSNHTELSDQVLDLGIKSCVEHLVSLSLSYVPLITNDGVVKLFFDWTNPPLMALDMSRNCDLSTEALVAIMKHSGESLQELNLNGWKDATNEALGSIATVCKQLKNVDLGWCREVDDFVVRDIIQGCPPLKTVKVWGCNRVEGKWKLGKKRDVKVYGIESETIRVM